ncbi:MAG: PDZ domain-containing protein [Solirubrobacteraceae bacterium]
MTQPKHLWSGDWERESDAAAHEQTSVPAPAEPREPQPPSEPPRASTYLTRRLVALTVIAAVVLVAAVWAATSLTGSSNSSSSAAAAAATNTGTSTAGATATQPVFPTGTGTSQSPTSTNGQGTAPPGATSTAPPASASNADSLGLVLQSVPVNRVIVQAVAPGSAAEQAGIGAGDQLLSVNGHPVHSPDDVATVLGKLPKGSKLTLQLLQGSAPVVATIQGSGIP